MVRKKSKFTRKRIYFALEAVLVVGIVAFLLIHNRSNQNSTTIPSTSPTPSSKTTPSAAATNNSQPSSVSNNSSDVAVAEPDKTVPVVTGSDSGPAKPSGDFVSNHSPGQNGSPNSETSACNTTAGAMCYITFTNSQVGSSKQLSPKLVDSTGSALWSWSAGFLTSGSWQVTAVATLNGQTQTTVDQIPLVVQ